MKQATAKLQKAFDLGAHSKRGGLKKTHLETAFAWMLDSAEQAAWERGWQWQHEQYHDNKQLSK